MQCIDQTVEHVESLQRFASCYGALEVVAAITINVQNSSLYTC